MSEGIMVALISGGISLAGILISQQKIRSVFEYRIGELEKKQDRHNDFMVRLAMVEGSVKSAHHRIDEVKAGGG